jgi:type I restriction enzyme, S subunit
VLRSHNIKGGRLDLSEPSFTDEAHFRERTRRAEPRAGDLIITREAPMGEVCMFPDGVRACLGQRMVLLRPNSRLCDSRFLLYALQSPAVQHEIKVNEGTGSTVSNLRIPLLEGLPVRVPSLREQQAIGVILGALDDKIELNRQLNETLEAMARAIFKSWFVDFEPVRTKAEGRQPTGMDPDTAALFPDSLEGSALGEKPRGWNASAWGDLVTLEYGRSLSGRSLVDGQFPVFGTNGRIGMHTEPLCSHAGVIIGRKGAYRGVHYSPVPFFVIDTAFYLEPRVNLELRWAYYVLQREDINAMDSGSAIPSTSRGDFYALPVLTPPYPVQARFVEFLAPMWSKQAANEVESEVLTSLRDALLPKLLSGEVRAPVG